MRRVRTDHGTYLPEASVLVCLAPGADDGGAVYTVTFKLLEVQHEEPGGLPILVEADDPCRPGREPTSIADANVFVSGFLKWDGCSEWDTEDSIHTCSGQQLAYVLAAILEARALSQELYDVPRICEDLLEAEPPVLRKGRAPR